MLIKLTMSKTLQERSYEPLSCSVTIEEEVSTKHYEREMKSLRKKVINELKKSIKSWGLKC